VKEIFYQRASRELPAFALTDPTNLPFEIDSPDNAKTGTLRRTRPAADDLETLSSRPSKASGEIPRSRRVMQSRHPIFPGYSRAKIKIISVNLSVPSVSLWFPLGARVGGNSEFRIQSALIRVICGFSGDAGGVFFLRRF